jgi:hypothetical protein
MRLAVPVVALFAVAASPRGGCSGPEQTVGTPMDAVCAGRACGDDCGDGWCDRNGACIPLALPIPVTCDSERDPACDGKACGDDCDLCGGMCMHPYATACDYAGRCVPKDEWICWDPCAGKACGAACHPCPPDDARCVEATVMMACHPSGACVASPVVCPP